MPACLPQLQALFAPESVPEQLLRLLSFQEEVGYGTYSQGLTLDLDEKSGLIHGWSTEPGFLEALFPFAMANASGSFYALWNASNTPNPATWPVVVFGDEGGEWVVARDVSELLAISTFDVEPMVDYREVFFYKSDDDNWESPHIDRYRAWLSENFAISSIEDPNPLIADAQDVWQEKFEVWKTPFLV